MSNMKSFGTVTAQIQKELAEDLIKTLKEALENPTPQYEIFMDIPYRKPLSWERVLEIGLECANDHSRLPFEVKVARAVEAAHGIK